MDITQRKSFKLFVIASGIIFAFLFFISLHDSAFGASLTDIHFLSNSQYEIMSDTTGQLDIVTTSTTGGAINISSRVGSGIFVNASNFVGIGTTSPGTPLYVVGTTTIAGNLSVTGGVTGTFTGTNSGATLASAVRGNGSVFGSAYDAAGTNYRFNDAANAALFYVDATNSRVGVGTASPGAKLDVQGIGFFGITNKLKIQESGNAMSIQATLATDDNAKKDIAISAWGGNVGIGTTGPETKLDVMGGATIGTGPATSRASSYPLMLFQPTNTNTSLYLWQNGVASGHVGFSANDSKLRIVNSYSNGALSNAAAIVLDTAGNVGIGTTSPGAKLEVKYGVQGALSLPLIINPGYYQVGSASGIGFLTDGTASYTKGALVYESNGTGWNVGKAFHFLLNNVSDASLVTLADAKMTILSNGNVGIGTTNPVSKFTVSDNVSTPQVPNTTGVMLHAVAADGVTSRLLLDTYQAAAGNGTTSVLNLRLARGTAASPSAVQKDDMLGLFAGYGYAATGYSGAKAAIQFRVSENWTDAAQGTYMSFYTTTAATTSAGERLRIDAAGNVGIGTTSPGYKLEVSGVIRSTNVYEDTTSLYNLAFGSTALSRTTTGTYNTAIGLNSLSTDSTGGLNTAIGHGALYFNTTGSNNVATGYRSLYANAGGSSNSAYGLQSLYNNTGGNSNSAVGYQSLYYNTTGGFNSAVGAAALYSNTAGFYNSALGSQALRGNTTGNQNTATGYYSLYTNTTGSNNVAVGMYALGTNNADNNAAVGYMALYGNTSGTANVAAGANALQSNNTGSNNSALGYYALNTNTSGYQNSAVGYYALFANTTGINNSAFGMQALAYNIIGNYNSAFGMQSLVYNTTGTGNVAVGNFALMNNTSGTGNVALGYNAGYNSGTSLQTGSSSTYLGYGATANADGYTNSTALGNGAIITASNQVMLGNSAVTQVVINGALKFPDGTTQSTAASGGGQWTTSGTNIYNTNTNNVGVGTTNPLAKFQVGSDNAGEPLSLGSTLVPKLAIFGAPSNTTEDSILRLIRPTFSGNLYPASVDFKMSTWNSLGCANGCVSRTKLNIGLKDGGSYDTSAVTDVMTLLSDGRVGIGNPSPAYKLTVAGTFSSDSGSHYTDGLGNVWAKSFYDADNSVYFFDPSATVSMKTAGSVGIGMTGTPNAPLEVNGGTAMTSGWNRTAMLTATFPTLVFNSFNTNWAGIAYDYSSNLMIRVGATSNDVFGTGVTAIAITQTGNVGIGTAAPGANKLYVNGAALINGALSMNGNNITSVNKLTVLAIDPLYNIGGTNYATYGPSIAGGVKEEYVGRARLTRNDKGQMSNDKASSDLEIGNLKLDIGGADYTFVIDFSKVEEGSDLWVWYNAVDFSRDNVEVFATPYGIPTAIAFEIEGTKIIFRGEKAVEFSYRLIGKRHDWKDWPTYAKDQNEKPSFTLEAK